MCRQAYSQRRNRTRLWQTSFNDICRFKNTIKGNRRNNERVRETISREDLGNNGQYGSRRTVANSSATGSKTDNNNKESNQTSGPPGVDKGGNDYVIFQSGVDTFFGEAKRKGLAEQCAGSPKPMRVRRCSKKEMAERNKRTSKNG